jgi:hypothetical protein
MKIGMERLFSAYLETLIAPAYAFLWPAKTMVKKPPLSQMENLVYFLLAAFTQISDGSKQSLNLVRADATHRNHAFAVNLYDFMEKFAPILVVYRKQLRSNDWSSRLHNFSRLLLLLLHFPCNQYVYGVMYSFLSYDYWANSYTQIYDLLSQNSHLFNEDIGEVLNGMLSRSNSLNFSVLSDVEKMSQRFLMLGGFARRRKGTLYGSVKSRCLSADGNIYDRHPMTRSLIRHLESVISSICDRNCVCNHRQR